MSSVTESTWNDRASAGDAGPGPSKTVDHGAARAAARFFAEPIRAKCLAMMSVLLATIVMMGATGIYGLYSISAKLGEVTEQSIARLTLTSQIKRDILEVARAQRNVILADSPAEIEADRTKFETEKDQMLGRVADLRHVLGEDGRRRLDALDRVLNEWFAVQQQVWDLKRSGSDSDAYSLTRTAGRKLSDQAASLVTESAAAVRRKVGADQAAGRDSYRAALVASVVGVVAAFLFAGVFGMAIFRNISRDIRRREEIEDRLRRLNDLLATRSAELERSNRELEQIAYVASHDLKAPLRAIQNLASWIAEDLGDTLQGESKQNLELLQGRVRRLEALLNDLLQYSRAGRVDGGVHELNVKDVIEDVLDLLSPPETFRVILPAELPTIKTARTPLEQVFGNLIGNALRHHDRSEGQVEISVADAGRFYEVAVRDDGPGIPERFHDRVFQMFQSLKPRDKVEGSGMGLAIVKKLVEAQGGQIQIESEDGKRGTTFRFHWPKTWRTKE